MGTRFENGSSNCRHAEVWSSSDDDSYILSRSSFLINGPERKRNEILGQLIIKKENYDTEELLHDLSTGNVLLNGELRFSFYNFTRMY